MSRATILYNRAKYEAERDNLPMNLRKDNIESMLFEAERNGVDVSCAVLRMNDPNNGLMYGNVRVVEQ